MIARFMGPTWGPSGANRTQVGLMLDPWALLSGYISVLGLKLIHVSKRGPREQLLSTSQELFTSVTLSPFSCGLVSINLTHIYKAWKIFSKIPSAHWCWDKMTAMFQTIFSNAFSWNENEIWWSLFLGVELAASIGSDNGLAPKRWQAVI